MPVLRELLMAVAPAPVASELVSLARLSEHLDAIVAAGRAAAPDLAVSDAEWAEFLARQLRVGQVAEQLQQMHAADVHLAIAALAGQTAAHAKLDRRLRAVAPQALSGIRLGTVSENDVLQLVRTKLLVGEGAERKLASYAGRGPLDGWLRITIARTALSLLRGRASQSMHGPREDETEVLANVATTDDPQLAALRAQCGPALSSAIEQAALELPEAERTLLRLHFVDGLTIDDLAVVFQTHRATSARRLSRARHALFENARQRAMATLGLDEAQFQSLMGVMLSQLDVTIRRVLGATSSSSGTERRTP
jgi:RNA polymerase sigma-70 factor (ECF subfamily)